MKINTRKSNFFIIISDSEYERLEGVYYDIVAAPTKKQALEKFIIDGEMKIINFIKNVNDLGMLDSKFKKLADEAENIDEDTNPKLKPFLELNVEFLRDILLSFNNGIYVDIVPIRSVT